MRDDSKIAKFVEKISKLIFLYARFCRKN